MIKLNFFHKLKHSVKQKIPKTDSQAQQYKMCKGLRNEFEFKT